MQEAKEKTENGRPTDVVEQAISTGAPNSGDVLGLTPGEIKALAGAFKQQKAKAKLLKEPDFVPTASVEAIAPTQTQVVECNRCGKCCESFPLAMPHETFYKEYHIPNQIENAKERFKGIELYGEMDGRNWFEFIVPIDSSEAERQGLNPIAFNTSPREHDDLRRQDYLHWYRCTLFQRDANGMGMCSAHESRPVVCRNYMPSGATYLGGGYLKTAEAVTHKDCSYLDYFAAKEAREKAEKQAIGEQIQALKVKADAL